MEKVSRETNVPVHGLSEWRDRARLVAEGALKERERDARDEEIERLRAKVGEIAMANELLYARIDMLEGGRPLAGRRLRNDPHHFGLYPELLPGGGGLPRLEVPAGDAVRRAAAPPCGAR